MDSVIGLAIDPMEAGVVTVGTVSGGRKANIIANRVELTGTMRSFDADVRRKLVKGLEDACGLAKWQGGDSELTLRQGHPATVNDPKLAGLVRQTALGFGLEVGEEKPYIIQSAQAHIMHRDKKELEV